MHCAAVWVVVRSCLPFWVAEQWITILVMGKDIKNSSYQGLVDNWSVLNMNIGGN
jgi:hypothetical protein